MKLLLKVRYKELTKIVDGFISTSRLYFFKQIFLLLSYSYTWAWSFCLIFQFITLLLLYHKQEYNCLGQTSAVYPVWILCFWYEGIYAINVWNIFFLCIWNLTLHINFYITILKKEEKKIKINWHRAKFEWIVRIIHKGHKTYY